MVLQILYLTFVFNGETYLCESINVLIVEHRMWGQQWNQPFQLLKIVWFCLKMFFQRLFIYWNLRVIERGGETERSLFCHFTSQMAPWPVLCQAEVRSQGLLVSLPVLGDRRPHIWIVFCLSHSISREQEEVEQPDRNQCLSAVLSLLVVA